MVTHIVAFSFKKNYLICNAHRLILLVTAFIETKSDTYRFLANFYATYGTHHITFSKKMTEKNLGEIVCQFVGSTIVGTERALFRTLPELLHKDETAQNAVLFGLVHYFNEAYVSLIKRNDKYIEEQFDAMHKINGHSYICLLNIVFFTTVDLLQQVKHESLNFLSLEHFTKSLQQQLLPLLTDKKNSIEARFQHVCAGIDIKTCDPDKPMFHIETKQK